MYRTKNTRHFGNNTFVIFKRCTVDIEADSSMRRLSVN